MGETRPGRGQSVVDPGRHAGVDAVRDGVDHIVYTSVSGAGDHLGFALAHRATERLVRSSGLGWTILRNGLYAELFGALLIWTPDGVESAFGAGSLSAEARADLAAAAAVVAAAPTSHAGLVSLGIVPYHRDRGTLTMAVRRR